MSRPCYSHLDANVVFNGLNNLFAYFDCVARIYNQQKSIKNHVHSYYSSNFYRFSVLLLCETLLRRWNLTIIVIFIAENLWCKEQRNQKECRFFFC